MANLVPAYDTVLLILDVPYEVFFRQPLNSQLVPSNVSDAAYVLKLGHKSA